MTKKILVLFLFVTLVFGFTGFDFSKVSAEGGFPTGCSSALGYSITTGHPCNGTTIATTGPLPGCTSSLGYSITNGRACSGGTIALQQLVGCTSILGYSTVSGLPCNGTTIAQISPTTPLTPTTVTPGLPTTGAGGNAVTNFAMLLSMGALVAFGITYLNRKSILVKK